MKDKTGENLYEYFIKSHDTGQGIACTALELLRSHAIKVRQEQIQKFLDNRPKHIEHFQLIYDDCDHGAV
jgi:hypothetical protein